LFNQVQRRFSVVSALHAIHCAQREVR
jgi:hypothetical protein